MPSSSARLAPCLALLALAALTATPVVAQDDPTRDDPTDDPRHTVHDEVEVEGRGPYFPDVVSTATKTPQDPERVPAAVSSISRQQLDEQAAVHLGEALETVPGVSVQTNAGVHDLFYLRGFDSLSSSLVLVGGAPELEATFFQLYNVDRVEVVRGPTGFLYGGSPIAGAVNLVPKLPSARGFVDVGLGFGSHSRARGTVDANWSTADGDGGLRVNGLYETADGWRDREHDVLAVNPVWTMGLGERTRVTVSLEGVSAEYEPDAGIPLVLPSAFGFPSRVADVDREALFQPASDFSEQDIVRFRVDVESQLTDRFTIRNKTYYNELDWQTRGTILGGAQELVLDPRFPALTVLPRFRQTLDDEQTLFGNQLEALWTFDGGAVSHELLAGLEVSRLTDEFTLDVALDTLLLGVDDPASEDGFLPVPFGNQADVTATVVAPYVLDAMSFGDRWRLFLGGRYDEIDFEDDVPGADGTPLDKSYGRFSPFAGLLFAPTDTVSVYANYGESFSPPSTTTAGDGRDPEEGRQVEIGAKARLGGVSASLAVYQLEKDNVAIPDAFGFTTQQGEIESEGVELELRGTLGAGLRWALAYAHTDAELVRFTELVQFGPGPTDFALVDRAGNRPAFAPENTFALWLSRRWDFGLGLAGGVRWLDDQFIDEANSFAIGDHTVVDLALSYRFRDVEAALHVENLTDEEYLGRGFGSGAVIPMDGVHGLVTLGARF